MGNPKFFPSDKLNSQYTVLSVKIDHDEAVHATKWLRASHLAAAKSDISCRCLGVDLDHGRLGRCDDKPLDRLIARNL